MTYTEDHIRALAPDPDSEKRGSQLARPDKWSGTGRAANAIWGHCQGSGSKPYQCVVDLSGPAYKCSCPSFKFPCKHSIGMMLLFTAKGDLFGEANPPDFASAWLEKRASSKIEKNIEAPAEEPSLVEEARVEKKTQRLKVMEKGIDLLERWLHDWVMQGLAAAENKDPEEWANAAARMVDAKITGAANIIREMALAASNAMSSQENIMVEKAAELQLLIKSFRGIHLLPEPMQEDLLQQLGVSINKNELANLEVVKDKWLVLGVLEGKTTAEIPYRRTYLYGLEQHRFGVNIEFAAPFAAAFEQNFIQHTVISAEAIYYPSNYPMRVFLKTSELTQDFPSYSFFGNNIAEVLENFALALSQNPWIREYPICLDQVTPVQLGPKQLGLADSKGDCLPLLTDDNSYWAILAKSGGLPIRVFGLWDGKGLMVI